MWIPQPAAAKEKEKKPAAAHAETSSTRDDMKIDAVTLDHYMAPAAEWRQYSQFRSHQLGASPKSTVFQRQAGAAPRPNRKELSAQ